VVIAMTFELLCSFLDLPTSMKILILDQQWPYRKLVDEWLEKFSVFDESF